MKDDDLTQVIIGCAYKVHNALGSGFLERVYENALRMSLKSWDSELSNKSPSTFPTRVKLWESTTLICGLKKGLSLK